MESLAASLYQAVTVSINEFAEIVADKYSVPKENIIDLWNSRVSNEIKAVEISKKRVIKPKATVTGTIVDEAAVCVHTFSRGDNAGQSCTSKATQNGYCKKHIPKLKKEGGDKAVKETKPKKLTKKQKEEKEKESPVAKTIKGLQLTLKRNSFGNYEHKESGLIISQETKECIGRQMTDGNIAPLTPDDIETCKRLNLKYEVPKTLNNPDAEVEEEEVEEEEVEEEEEVVTESE